MTPYGERALTDELAILRTTGNGGRNNQLNRSAFAVAQLVAGEQIDPDAARRALNDAAAETGLEHREIASTLNNAWKDGMAQPRYVYGDPDGRVAYAKTRVGKPDKKYTVEHRASDGAWREGRGGCDAVPYRLADLVAAAKDATLYMAEGEKHADKLARWGLLATSYQSWSKSFAEHVAGRSVTIIPDNDKGGEDQAKRTYGLVTDAGGFPVIVRLPRLEHKGDVMDWDGDADELRRLVEAARAKGRKKALYESGISASALLAKQFDPIRYIVPGYVAEGLTLLAGPPKVGKSWMALGLALSVASGRPAFGSIAVGGGDVLYLALEDNERRLKKRLLHMNQGAPERLTFMTEWPAMDEGAIDQLEAWVASAECPRLIVVDVLTKVRGGAKSGETAYEADYRALTGLQGIAGRHGIAVIAVHHTRKMEAEDPFDSVSGTRGLTGAADTVLVVKRDIGTGGSGRVTLYGRGRDIEEIETALEFNRDNGTWRIVGAAHEVAKTDERQGILDCLANSDNPLNAREVSDLTGKSYDAVRKTLTRMAQAGEVEKSGRGQYTCPNGPIVPTDAPTPSRWDIGTHGTGGIDADDIGDPRTWEADQ